MLQQEAGGLLHWKGCYDYDVFSLKFYVTGEVRRESQEWPEFELLLGDQASS